MVLVHQVYVNYVSFNTSLCSNSVYWVASDVPSGKYFGPHSH